MCFQGSFPVRGVLVDVPPMMRAGKSRVGPEAPFEAAHAHELAPMHEDLRITGDPGRGRGRRAPGSACIGGGAFSRAFSSLSHILKVWAFFGPGKSTFFAVLGCGPCGARG